MRPPRRALDRMVAEGLVQTRLLPGMSRRQYDRASVEAVVNGGAAN